MSKRQTLAGTIAIAALVAGCHSQSTAHERFSYNNPNPGEQPKVTVRFVNQPGLAFVSNCRQHDMRLVNNTQLVHDTHAVTNESNPWAWNNLFKCKESRSTSTQSQTTDSNSPTSSQFQTTTDSSSHAPSQSQTMTDSISYQTSPFPPDGRTDFVTTCNMGGFAQGEIMPQHAILWGRGHHGCDVTAFPTALNPGAYTFAYFDPDRGTAYQGWLAINSGGDDVLSSLTEWRDTVHRQEEWLAFENKMHGKYASRDHADFKRFSNELASLRRLESKINAAIYAEQMDRQQMYQWRNDYLGDAEVVLMPGPAYNFAQPITLPAFQPADLSAALGGQPITKVILAGDFSRSMEKLDRLTDLQNEMRRCRAVLNEEVVRLENRRSYFRLTSHLYNHDDNFVNNLQRIQQARGMVAKLDRQITENRHHGHAVLTVVGLFAPEEAALAFGREQSEIRGERAIWAERLNQVEMQFNDASTWSEKRIALEAQRQYLMAQLNECDTQLDQCDQAADAVAQLRQNTGVIYRNGPAAILAASYMTDSVPARLADAIEKESMMTIRLHSAEGVRPTPKHLTEGFSTQQEQTFMLTGDRPQAGQYGNYNDDDSDNDQPNLGDWSDFQRNFGLDNPSPSNCGQPHSDEP